MYGHGLLPAQCEGAENPHHCEGTAAGPMGLLLQAGASPSAEAAPPSTSCPCHNRISLLQHPWGCRAPTCAVTHRRRGGL